MTNPSQLVQKLWNYCNIRRDDGLSYGDYVEQLTFLLFLKMADEQSKPPFNKPSVIPKRFDWSALLKLDGDSNRNQQPAKSFTARLLEPCGGGRPSRLRLVEVHCAVVESRQAR